MVNLEDLGADYARTLEVWRHRFESQWSDIAMLGYDERFRRLWRFYLCYCEGGFRERALSDVQVLLAKPGYRGRPGACAHRERALVVNAALLQLTWFAAVGGGTIAATFACTLFAAHVLSRGGWRELTLAAVVGAVGLGLDTLWIYGGLLDYHGALLAPPSIVVFWIAVGFSLNYSLSMCIGRPWLGGALAAVACSLSCLGASTLGALIIPSATSLVVVALGGPSCSEPVRHRRTFLQSSVRGDRLMGIAHAIAERGYVPDFLVRREIRRLIRDRLHDERRGTTGARARAIRRADRNTRAQPRGVVYRCRE